MNTNTQAPEIIYVNPRTMQVVGEGYPNAVKYVRDSPAPGSSPQAKQERTYSEGTAKQE